MVLTTLQAVFIFFQSFKATISKSYELFINRLGCMPFWAGKRHPLFMNNLTGRFEG